jgi:hypothetical protein
LSPQIQDQPKQETISAKERERERERREKEGEREGGRVKSRQKATAKKFRILSEK